MLVAVFTLMDAANRAFQNIVLILQPREKNWTEFCGCIYRHTAGLVLALIIRQIGTQITPSVYGEYLYLSKLPSFQWFAVIFQRFLNSLQFVLPKQSVYQLLVIVHIFLFCLCCNFTAKRCVFKHFFATAAFVRCRGVAAFTAAPPLRGNNLLFHRSFSFKFIFQRTTQRQFHWL